MEWMLIVQITSIVAGFFAVIFGFATWLRNRTHDTNGTSANMGMVLEKLGTLSESLAEIKTDVKDIWKDNSRFREVQARDTVRIDGLEERISKVERQLEKE